EPARPWTVFEAGSNVRVGGSEVFVERNDALVEVALDVFTAPVAGLHHGPGGRLIGAGGNGEDGQIHTHECTSVPEPPSVAGWPSRRSTVVSTPRLRAANAATACSPNTHRLRSQGWPRMANV